jgi:multiple sugar transport system permease protein
MWRDNLRAALYLLPALTVLTVFNIYPVIRALTMSLHVRYNFLKREVYERGLDNFSTLYNDTRFHDALGNTMKFVFGVVPLTIVIALFIAVLLNSKIKGASFYRAVYFLPFVTSVVAIGTVWSWVFHTNHGILNYFLGLFGAEGVAWLSAQHAMTALIIMSVWQGLGFNVVILLAGLQTVDRQLYMAARVDGARPWQRMLRITVPMLSPSIFFLSVMGVINASRVFGEVYALFGGTPGPANSALTVVYYIMQRFWEWRFGMASAAAVVLFVILFAITLLQRYIGTKWVHYG